MAFRHSFLLLRQNNINKIEMGDFGAIVYVRKTDREPFTAEEKEQFQVLVDQVRAENDFSDAFAEPYRFSVGATRTLSGEMVALNLLLSDHHGDQENYTWCGEVEEKDAGKVAELVQAKLPEAWKAEGVFEWW